MSLYSDAPPPRPFSDDKPTLLVCWWIAGLCAVVIALRLAGRYIRIETLLIEDKIAAVFLAPLFLRTAVVHVVLLFGTNNILLATEDSLRLSDEEIRRRSIGSGLVLLARLLHPAAIWTLKFVNLEFFGRIATTRKSNYPTLWYLRGTLAATFLAVLIADLSECRPSFPQYWTVTPDPGGACRQGYAHLLTTSICSALTDLLLVVFPIPVILSSQLKFTKKIILVLLFSLGLCNVAASLYRAPRVISEQGYQGTRTTWASVEILVATFVANALALGSFVRDTGAKKKRFRRYDARGELIPESLSNRSGNGNCEVGRERERGRGRRMGSGIGPLKRVGRSSSLSSRGTDATTTGDIVIKCRGDDGSDGGGGGGGKRGRDAGDLGLYRTASRDSLIPREATYHGCHASASAGAGSVDRGVVKTTTIQVTVMDADLDAKLGGGKPRPNALIPSPPPMARSRSTGSRGRGRGSTVMLREMEPLPLPGQRERVTGGTRH